MPYTPNRRDFMRQSVAGLCAAGLARSAFGAAEAGDQPMPTRPFGKTGFDVSILGLGGHHCGRIKDDQEAVDFIRAAIDMGVTFMDNAWEYHDGRSEELMGRALQDGYRDKVFLMTKHHGRDKKTAMQHLEDSLRRLNTDVIDLWQFHEVVYEADPGMIFAEQDGGIEAAIEAKESGKVRFIGFTGHKDPRIFLDMLSRDYEWDAVQMPVNVLDAHFKSFQKEVLPILRNRGIGAIAMKSTGSGFVLRSGAATPQECLRYAWSQPIDTIVSGMENMDLLRENVQFAKSFQPLSQEEESQLLAKAKEPALSGEFEPFKTTRMFDGGKGRKLHGIA